MSLSPGVRFIFSTVIPTLAIPPLATHGLYIVLSVLYPPLKSQLNGRALIAIDLSSLLVYTFIRIRVAILLNKWRAHRRNMRCVPEFQGKWPGNLDILSLQMSSSQKLYIGQMWIPMVNKLGTNFSIRILNDYRLCTMNPLNIQRILATDFEHYGKGNFVNAVISAMLGEGVFNSDGDLWQFHRKSKLLTSLHFSV